MLKPGKPAPSVSGEIVLKAPRLRLTGDAFELLKEIPDGSIDLIVTDPPFPSIEFHRKIGTTTRLKKHWFPTIEDWRFVELLEQFSRVLRKNSHCYIFVDEPTQFVIKTQQLTGQRFPNGAWKTISGLKYWKSLTWVKTSQADRPVGHLGYHWRSTTGLIMMFEKGKRALKDRTSLDLLFGRYQHNNGYPTAKPREILEKLIYASSYPDDVVLDPFCGSGSTGVVAGELDRQAILIDILSPEETDRWLCPAQ